MLMAGANHVANCGCRFDAQCGPPAVPAMPVPEAVKPDTTNVPDAIDWGQWESVREDVWRRKVTHSWHLPRGVFAQWHWEFLPVTADRGTGIAAGRWQGDFYEEAVT